MYKLQASDEWYREAAELEVAFMVSDEARPSPRITPEQYWADLNERMPD